MLKENASRIARAEMKSGSNCCQAVLLAAAQVWDIPMGEDMLAAAAMFGQGMESGCTCGALTGMIMAAGIMDKYHPHPAGTKLPQQLHDEFKREIGAVCCRVIRKQRPLTQQLGNRACVELTGKAAGILAAKWEGVMDIESA